MTTRRTRPGVTLTEVLIAIFVMALGMLALLTLFPLGAMQMAQKFKDDRTSQTAGQAEGFLRTYWRYSVAVPPAGAGEPPRDEPLIQSFDNPNAPPPAPFANPPIAPYYYPQFFPRTTAPYPLPAGTEASYPVLIDPLGLFARPSDPVEQFWTAAKFTAPTVPVLPRRGLALVVTQNDYQNTAIQTCCMIDDMTFLENGMPMGSLERQGRYTWAAIVQRPRNEVPNIADLTILVFDQRPPLLATPGDEVIVTPTAPVTPGVRSLTVVVPTRSTDQVPLIRKGGWIMDGTISGSMRHARFYRIAGVTEGTPDPATGTTLFALDLDTEIKRTDGLGTSYTPTLYLFAGLSEVFERPQLRPDDVQ